MSFIRSETVAATTNSSGESTAFSANVNGKIHAVEYVWTDFSTAATLVVKGENSSRPILTANLTSTTVATWYPRAVTHNVLSGSTFGGEASVPISNERVRFIVASGGATKTGTFRILVD